MDARVYRRGKQALFRHSTARSPLIGWEIAIRYTEKSLHITLYCLPWDRVG
jgi:hypothetical protein